MAAEPEVSCPSCGEKVPANFAQCWKCRADLASAAAPGAPRRAPEVRCTHCRGTGLERGIKVGTGVSHPVGMLFAGGSFAGDLLGGSLEPLRADLCTECGTVVRWWVDEPDRLWVK